MSTPSGRYIHRTKSGWKKDPMYGKSLNIEGAYIKARDQFNKNAMSGAFEKDIFQKVLALLKQKGTVQGQLGEFIQQLDSLRSGQNAIHAQDINVGGYTTSLGSLAFAKKRGGLVEFRKAISAATDSGGQCVELGDCLQKILNYIDSFGNFQGGQMYSSGKIRVGGAKGVTFLPLKETSQIANSYHMLEQIIQRTGKTGTIGTGLTENGIKTIAKQLKSIGNTFIRNFSGALNEFTRVAETQAVLNVEDNIKKITKSLKSYGVKNINFQVNQIGASHLKSDSGTKRVSKGDTEVIMNYKINGKDGVWRTTISEKSGRLGVISKFNQNKSFSGNLAGGASYDTIFNGLGWQIEKLFCNTYIHESVQNDTMLMSYIGARAASNIVAGTAGAGQAAILRENNELISIGEFFNTILKNPKNIDRYINLRVEPLKPDGTVRSANKKVLSDDGDIEDSHSLAEQRSEAVYQAIKDSVHFYANLGSRRGFNNTI